jgi:Zn-dependent protease with chaperone function
VSVAVLAVSLSLLAYAAFVLVATAIVVLPLSRARKLSEPAARARRLVVLRLLPSLLASFLVAGVVLPAFLVLEPREGVEPVTAGLALFASFGALLLTGGPIRAFLSVRATRRLLKRWDRTARPIVIPGVVLPAFVVEEPFPIVTLAGWFRPRLLVARSVLSSCDERELAAILAHEAGHHERLDSWVRLLLRGCPDLLALLPWADRVERAWADAAEHDADERAAGTGPSRATDLASALVKVARLAGARPSPALANAALYRGENVAGRVARLLELDPERNTRAAGPRTLLLAASFLAVLVLIPAVASLGIHQHVHGALEAVVSAFP